MNIELSEEQAEKLTAMMAECKFVTMGDLFNNALTLMDYVVQNVKRGKIIGCIDMSRKTYHELSMPFMKNVRKP